MTLCNASCYVCCSCILHISQTSTFFFSQIPFTKDFLKHPSHICYNWLPLWKPNPVCSLLSSKIMFFILLIHTTFICLTIQLSFILPVMTNYLNIHCPYWLFILYWTCTLSAPIHAWLYVFSFYTTIYFFQYEAPTASNLLLCFSWHNS